MPYLIMSKSSSGYKVIHFSNALKVGRDESNDIVLNELGDHAISRIHAYIEDSKGSFILHDRSTNGTFVDNERVTEFPLHHGITFEIIDYLFTFIEDSGAEEIESKRFIGKDGRFEDIDINGDESTTVLRRAEDEESKKAKLKNRLREEGVIVESENMIGLYMDIQEVARVNVPVCILGEPGTGKEKIAHALHAFSNVGGEFVPLNCSSIPEGIFESELFGSVKGAFHNATDKPGKLEQADNGTIFLDEIGDMNISIQPKLLRFLEDKNLTRLGDTKTKKINVRFVAATNQDLKSMMKEKTFREDLYQRLACIKLSIPPLRERQEDILPLAMHFLTKFSTEHGIKVSKLSDSAAKMLMEYHWPGNVRELGNILLSVSVRNQGKTIFPANLTDASEEIKMPRRPVDKSKPFPSMKDMEKQHVKEALERTKWNKADASKLLGISRDTLYKKIEKYKITEEKEA